MKGCIKMQRFTSKNTSINSSKLPMIYGNRKVLEIIKGKSVIDVGGGKFDNAVTAMKKYGASVAVYDPYNRTEEHNSNVLSRAYDVAIISNVLNVIDSVEAREKVLELAASKAEIIIITVYEGNGSGVGKQSKVDCWQENRPTADYMEEIRNSLPGYNVERSGKIIFCKK